MGDETSTCRASTCAKTWSLSWKAAPGRDFLAHERMAEKIRARLIDAHRQPGRELIFYVVMPTEIHVVARVVGRESVASIVRSCSHILSRWVREVHVHQGPAFATKCRASPLDSLQALGPEIQMLGWRPVRLGLCSRPQQYAHSTLTAATQRAAAGAFDSTPLLRILEETPNAARASLDALLRTPPSDEAWRVWELKRGLEQPTAQQSYVSATTMPRTVDASTATLIAAGGGYGIEGALSLMETWVCTKLDPARRLNTQSGLVSLRVRVRAVVACLAVDHRLCSAVFVARHYGCTKGTLSVQMTRCRTRSQDRKLLQTSLERILSDAAELRAAGLTRSVRGPRGD